jgi:Flp pilus assembly protein TadB
VKTLAKWLGWALLLLALAHPAAGHVLLVTVRVVFTAVVAVAAVLLTHPTALFAALAAVLAVGAVRKLRRHAHRRRVRRQLAAMADPFNLLRLAPWGTD